MALRFSSYRIVSVRFVTTGLVGVAVQPALLFADDLSGSDSLLCYGLSAARCEIGRGDRLRVAAVAAQSARLRQARPARQA